MTISESAKTNAEPSKKPFTIVVLGRNGSGKSTLITALCYYIIKHHDEFLLQMEFDKEDTGLLRDWISIFDNKSFPPKGDQPKKKYGFNFSITSLIKKVKHDIRVVETSLPEVNQETINRFKGVDLVIFTIDSRKIEQDDVYFSLLFEALFSTKTFIPMIFVLTKYDLIKTELKEQYDRGELFSSLMSATFKRLKYSNYKIPKYLKFSIDTISGFHKVEGNTILSFHISDCEELFSTIYQYLNNHDDSIKDKERSKLESELENLRKRLANEPENPEILQEMKSIYEKLGEDGKAKSVEDTLERLDERKEFQYNLNNPVSLQKLELNHLDFFGDTCWRFKPQINVLLGKNGYGKTHLLRLLAAILQKDDDKIAEFPIQQSRSIYQIGDRKKRGI